MESDEFIEGLQEFVGEENFIRPNVVVPLKPRSRFSNKPSRVHTALCYESHTFLSDEERVAG